MFRLSPLFPGFLDGRENSGKSPLLTQSTREKWGTRLNGKRPLNVAQIRKLAAKFRVSAAVFV